MGLMGRACNMAHITLLPQPRSTPVAHIMNINKLTKMSENLVHIQKFYYFCSADTLIICRQTAICR